MVLEPKEQGEPQSQRRVVKSQPTRHMRSRSPGAPDGQYPPKTRTWDPLLPSPKPVTKKLAESTNGSQRRRDFEKFHPKCL